MKKLMKIIAVLSCAVVLLTGCGGTEVKAIDTAGLADDLYSGVTWKDQLGEVDLSKALTVYGISTEAVSTGKVYMGTNATAEEIAVLEAASPEQVAAVEAGIKARVEAQLASFQSYNAAEVVKLENPLIQTKGNYVILCVCDDKSEAESIVDACFEKE
ncbi:MAG: DUF4358 domain-containing protein [Bacteroides sp.]|nr:DUF4358 domain-containing protein [Bacteroides sp.]MCM1550816.1 DUF4358 domain-containing protein [Clostridium sp.]